MPSVSKKQHGFMAAIANNPKFAKKVGVSKSVGKDYMKADKGRKFKEGGLKETDAESNPGLAKLPTEVRNKMGYMKKGGMAKSDAKEDMKMDKSQDKAMIKKAFKQHDMQEHKGGKGTKLTLKKGGMACAPKKMAKGGSFRSSADGCATKGKTKGTQIKMKMGGAC
jgi:hypothetical protein